MSSLLPFPSTLFAEAAAFSPYQQLRWESEQARPTTAEKGPGRRERRTLTAPRHVVVRLLEGVEAPSKASALRWFAISPLQAWALLTKEPEN